MVFRDTIPAEGARRPERVPTVIRKIYFDHGGLVWEIHSSSLEAADEENYAHYEHLLETFKILEPEADS